MRLRLLHTRPLDGATNMALDEALLVRARDTGDLTVRVYTWARPTLSFGRNQTACGAYDPERTAELGVDVVRRPTGGRAVLHARELTYSVAGRTDLLGERTSLTATHARVTAMIADALASLGADVATAAPSVRARRPDASPCFAAPASGELVTRRDTRKLVGSAQWREDGAFLQHGSILIEDDQSLLAACAVAPTAATLPSSVRSTVVAAAMVAPATLAMALGRAPGADEVARAVLAAGRRLGAALRAHEDASINSCEVPAASDYRDDEPLAREVARLLPRYRDPQWTWRR